MYSVLCIDDAEEQLQTLTMQLIDSYHVMTCKKPLNALPIILKHRPDAIILDLQMPSISGFSILSEIKSMANPPPVLMLSGHTDPLFVVRALHLGARDFLSKPYTSAMLRHRLTKIIQSSLSEKHQTDQDHQNPVLIGNSGAIQKLKIEIQVFSNADLPIVILGESGTGKDLVAQAIHQASFRCKGPYIVRNIGAIPVSLIESELFGCDEGAFTDAKHRQGCFELANGGTLFLDEIAEASLSVQTALLRVIEDGFVQHLGSNSIHQVSFRLITATHKNLEELIANSQFRADLKYRLEGITLHIPPLRDRKEDIPILVQHFLPLPTTEISQEAMDKLLDYDWPGNVRQLRMCMERAKILATKGRIESKHICF